MKRIIDGKAYNTDTALHVAHTESSYMDDRAREHDLVLDLYRTKGGAFFLVEFDGLDADDEDNRRETVTFYPVSYDTAHAFASGRSYKLGYSNRGAEQVELRAAGIFPEVPEAADAPSLTSVS
jgi:hypothetical protein